MIDVDPRQIPPMPEGWFPVRTDAGRRLFPDDRLGQAGRRLFWLREHGYLGLVDQDGRAVAGPVATLVPGDWWIAEDGEGTPCVWAPTARADQPDCMLRQISVHPAVWAIFAAVLPDRGACEWCTTVACAEHAEE